jgi:ubiquitin-protein ligase
VSNEARFKNELENLLLFKRVLDGDNVLPVRLEIERMSLDYRRFKVVINGIKSLTANKDGTRAGTGTAFKILVEVPPEYPFTAIPNIQFQDTIPFHPHVYTDGRICWGTVNSPQPDLSLADWIRQVLEYLTYNKDSIIKMNPNSPANRTALDWWQSNKLMISSSVTSIDMSRVRLLVNRTIQ